ncbi:alpha/beta hydrolase [Nocardia harenae]|uniref:alpha/beta hydrolase n=1 Tax=Nocardia harenae TaxID=358707 RepID=UPI00082AF11E|nr:alpha/beta hydrolase [Nocardia harenae]
MAGFTTNGFPESGTFDGSGGRVAWYTRQPGGAPRGVVILVHGVAEHAGRYAELAEHLSCHGFAVYTFDHIGHGGSAGAGTANIGSMETAADHVATLLDRATAAHPRAPRFLLGHSMGSLVVLHLLTRDTAPELAGVVLSAPPLDIPLGNPVQRLLAPLLTRALPGLGVLQLDSAEISRDPEVVRRYDEDPLVFRGKLPARTAVEIMETAGRLKERLGRVHQPLLVLHGTGDTIAAPAGADLLDQRVTSTDKCVLRYDGLYHEVFNEPERKAVFADLTGWLRARSGPAHPSA